MFIESISFHVWIESSLKWIIMEYWWVPPSSHVSTDIHTCTYTMYVYILTQVHHAQVNTLTLLNSVCGYMHVCQLGEHRDKESVVDLVGANV